MQGVWRKTLLVNSLLLSMWVSSLAAGVNGTVYRELPVTGQSLNTYGVKEANEHGVAGITVTVTDSSGNVVGVPVVTDSSGNWSVSGTTGDVRVEFSNIPSYLSSSPVNTGSKTTVQFVSDGSTADLGLFNASEYVTSGNPDFLTSAYINGDPLLTTGNGEIAGTFRSIFRVNNSASGDYDPTQFTTLADAAEVGAVWGMAYHVSTKTLFSSAFVKRHVGLGSLGSGGIYATNVDNATTTAWLDVNTLSNIDVGADPRVEEGSSLPAERGAPNHDLLAFAAVGKRGLGDIDLSEDGKHLYVINLGQRTLLTLDVATKSLVNAPLAIPNPSNGQCPDDDIRPFALGVNDGEVYVGAVCSAQSSGQVNDLHAYVLRLDNNSFTNVFDFDLNFSRGFGNGGASDPVIKAPSDWQPWTDNWADVVSPEAWPTYIMSPVFSNIEFDSDGSLLLGFMDRAGHQLGAFNYPADASSTLTRLEGLAQGDIYRACPSPTGGWALENNGSCGGVTTTGASNNEGPGGGEFYVGDFGGTKNYHQNASVGGVAVLPGAGRIAVSTMNPILRSAGSDFTQYGRRMGIKWLSNTTGDHEQGITLVPFTAGNPTTGNTHGTFSKANGLGELELLTNPAPLEIGNRVWDDLNGNGIQDAGEAGIDGVTVTLNCGGADFIQTTAGGGHYLFTDVNVTGGIPRETGCTLSVPTTNNNKPLTISNFSVDEPLGSNADISTGRFSFITGLDGDNNHTYDFGYTSQPEVDLELNKAANPTSSMPGDNVVYTLTLTNNGPDSASNVVVSDKLPGGVTYVSATGGTSVSESNGLVTWNISSVAANATETLTVTVKVD